MKHHLSLLLTALVALPTPGFHALAQNAPAGPPVPPPLVRPARRSIATNANAIPAGTNSTRIVPARGTTTVTPAAGAGTPAPGGLQATPPGGASSLPGATNAIMPPTENLGALAPDALVPAGMLRFQAQPLEQVLQIYAMLTDRIVLRPNMLPAISVTLDATHRELTKEEAIQALDSVLQLNGITMIPSGSKFVSAVPNAQALQEGAAFSDVEIKDMPEAAQFVTKVVQLKHALPTEVMPLLAGFGKVQNGVVPIDSSGTIVLRDYSANVKRMMEIIDKVDVESEGDYKLEVIPIRYGKVEDIYATMSSLIGGGAGGGVSGGLGASASGARRTATGGSASRSGTGSRSSTGGYNNSRQGTGNRNNTGMNTQQAGAQRQVGAAGQVGGQALNASTSFNQRLQGVVNRMSGQSGQMELLGDAKIVPDERSNSLIVFANKQDLVMITNMVSKVDRLLAQVLIESVIMDVSLTGELEYGVSSYFKSNDGNFSNGGIMNPANFIDSIRGNSTNGNTGGITTPSNKDGLYWVGRYKDDLTVAVRALAANGRGNILSTPRVQTSHATPASFSVGRSVPYVAGSYGGYSGIGGYAPSSYVQYLDILTELNVTPYITPDSLIVMDIEQNINELVGYVNLAGNQSPETITRSATATISVQDKDTIILGGFVRAGRSKTVSGIPVLKDLPWLGPLFSSTNEKKDRTELIIFIKPTVLLTPRDAALFASDSIKTGLPGIRRMEQEMQAEQEKLTTEVDKALDGKKPKSKPAKTPPAAEPPTN